MKFKGAMTMTEVADRIEEVTGLKTCIGEVSRRLDSFRLTLNTPTGLRLGDMVIHKYPSEADLWRIGSVTTGDFSDLFMRP